jgi:penicillin-insensitive murein endopeptidase
MIDRGLPRIRVSICLKTALLLGLFGGLLLAGAAQAQDKGTLDPKPLPPLAHPQDPATPAKELFGRQPEPASLAARSLGFYSRGCLAGAKALPVDGPAWQVMRRAIAIGAIPP